MAIPRSPLPRFTHQASDWTPERIDKLERAEIEQLRFNAVNLGEEGVAKLCDAALAARPKTRRASTAKTTTTAKVATLTRAKVTPLGRAKVAAVSRKEKGNG